MDYDKPNAWGNPREVESDISVVLPGTLETVKDYCGQVALDLGLETGEASGDRLVFRDPFRFPLFFSTELSVELSERRDVIGAYVVGSGLGGRDSRQYVAKLVRAFSQRLQERSLQIQEGEKGKHRRRMLLTSLLALQWLPVALAAPMLIVPRASAGGKVANLFALVWFCLLFVLPVGAELSRRHLTGTGSPDDYGMFAGMVLVALASVAFFALAGII
jgi:hypothetical protein